MNTCYQHPDRQAVEQCETCRRPVCGSCLWYAESGERLCPEHAAEAEASGKPVQPPGRYAAGIMHSEAAAAQPSAADVPYRGNSTDLGALLAAIAGIMALLACAGLSWLVPAVAFVLGLVSWMQARDAVDARRARWLAGVGIASGGVFLVFAVGFFAIGMLCMFFSLAMSLGGPNVFPTPTPWPAP